MACRSGLVGSDDDDDDGCVIAPPDREREAEGERGGGLGGQRRSPLKAACELDAVLDADLEPVLEPADLLDRRDGEETVLPLLPRHYGHLVGDRLHVDVLKLVPVWLPARRNREGGDRGRKGESMGGRDGEKREIGSGGNRRG